MATWDPYPDGAYVAQLRILDRIATGPRQIDVRYQVRYLCCDAIGELTHADVLDRIRRRSQYCHACALEAARKVRAGADAPRVPDSKGYVPGWGWPISFGPLQVTAKAEARRQRTGQFPTEYAA
jgi:hypothetical protein